MKPALSAEQWDEYADEREGYLNIAVLGEAGDVLDGRPHETAALMLHNQPFGFTWDDVRILRRMAQRGRRGQNKLWVMGKPTMRDPVYGELENLADRIEALLRPGKAS